MVMTDVRLIAGIPKSEKVEKSGFEELLFPRSSRAGLRPLFLRIAAITLPNAVLAAHCRIQQSCRIFPHRTPSGRVDESRDLVYHLGHPQRTHGNRIHPVSGSSCWAQHRGVWRSLD